MKSGSVTFERCLIAAGVVVSVAAWWRRVEPLPEGPDDVPLDDAARRAGDFEVELTRARRAPRSRRFATSLTFATLFFAGAAFTAGAGNQLAHTDEPAAVAATTEAAPAPAADPAPATADAAAAPEATSAVAPAATEAAPDATQAPAAASPDEMTPTTAPVRADYVAPAPGTAPAAAPATAAPRAHPAHKHAQTRRTESLPAPLFPAAASFVPAVPFDLQAWEHDNPASSTGATAVAIAKHFVGTPYVWGGASPSGGFDCSGLMQFVYRQLGVSLPHYAAAQFAIFPRLSPSDLQPGDLVFFEPKIDGPGHVAMYIGGDAILEAPHTGALVRIGSLARSAAALGFMGAVRPYSAASASRLIAAHDSARAHGSGIGPAESALAV